MHRYIRWAVTAQSQYHSSTTISPVDNTAVPLSPYPAPDRPSCIFDRHPVCANIPNLAVLPTLLTFALSPPGWSSLPLPQSCTFPGFQIIDVCWSNLKIRSLFPNRMEMECSMRAESGMFSFLCRSSPPFHALILLLTSPSVNAFLSSFQVLRSKLFHARLFAELPPA